MAWVTRWRCPAPPAGRDLGEVEPLRLQLARRRAACSSSAALGRQRGVERRRGRG